MAQRSRSTSSRYVVPHKRRFALLDRLARQTRGSKKSAPSKGGSSGKKGATIPKSSSGRRGKDSPEKALILEDVFARISGERKIDILGVLIALIGLVSLVSLFSASREGALGLLMRVVRGTFGFGAFVVPLAFVVLGVWLMLRRSERFPEPVPERLVGLALLFVNVLAWLSLVQNALRASIEGTEFVRDLETALAFDTVSAAGGYLGGLVEHLLAFLLGAWGAAVVLLAWFVIALMLSLDVSVPELFAWLAPFAAALEAKRRRLVKALADRIRPPAPSRPVPMQRATAPVSAPVRMESIGMSAVPTQPAVEVPAAPPWTLPALDQILEPEASPIPDEEADGKRVAIIQETLASFGAPGRVVEINRGPTITQYGVEPDFVETRRGRMRVRVGKIASLADDLALALAARRIRIQAPVPGKGFIGIEVPNEHPAMVSMRSIVDSPVFGRLKSPLRFALGQNVSGESVAVDLTSMPHLLIAGATGSGKSVCVNSIVTCFLLHNTPETLRLLMVDPKRVELSGYNGIPHLLAPVVVELKQVVGALQWVTREMDRRYHAFADVGVRSIAEFNRKVKEKQEAAEQEGVPSTEHVLPHLVVIIDELADLMMLAPDETERAITRLAQLARATGIHLILATQRPSVDVVTGVIKANFPARIAFTVASGTDSRVILDQPGAERLLGSGDMLFQAPDAPAPVRLQGVYVSDTEIQRLVYYWRTFALQVAQATPEGEAAPEQPAFAPEAQQLTFLEEPPAEEGDPLMGEAIDLSRRQGRASVSMLQRRLRIGYTRASRLMDAMEERGVVGPPNPETGTRDILDYGEAAPQLDE